MSQARVTPLTKLLLLMLIAVTMPLAGYCLKLAYADALTYPVRYFISKQEQQAKLPKQQQLAKHISQTEQALALSPYQQDLTSYLARLHYYQAQYHEYLSEKYLTQIQIAKTYHLKNLEQRPKWSASWAETAKLSSLIKAPLSEVLISIQKAESYGPWELSSNLNILSSLLINWNSIKKELQNKSIKISIRASTHSLKKTSELITHHKKKLFFCRKISTKSKLFKSLCI